MSKKSNTKMSDAAIQARREYNRQWRAKNPDKVKQYKINHWERVAAEKVAKGNVEETE